MLLSNTLRTAQDSVKITYVDEKISGTAGSLSLLQRPNNQPTVTNADIITEASYSDILEFHK